MEIEIGSANPRAPLKQLRTNDKSYRKMCLISGLTKLERKMTHRALWESISMATANHPTGFKHKGPADEPQSCKYQDRGLCNRASCPRASQVTSTWSCFCQSLFYLLLWETDNKRHLYWLLAINPKIKLGKPQENRHEMQGQESV